MALAPRAGLTASLTVGLTTGLGLLSSAGLALETAGATVATLPGVPAGGTAASGARRRLRPRITSATPAAPTRIHFGKRLGGADRESEAGAMGGLSTGAAFPAGPV